MIANHKSLIARDGNAILSLKSLSSAHDRYFAGPIILMQVYDPVHVILATVSIAAAIALAAADVPVAQHVRRWIKIAIAALILGFPLTMLLLMFVTLFASIFVGNILVNVAIYYAAALPGLMVAEGWPLKRRLPVALAGPAVLAILPPALLWLGSQLTERALKQDDLDKPLPAARIIRIDLWSETEDGRRQGSDTQCRDLCQRLLAEGYAQAVRTASFEFTLEQRADCPDVLAKDTKLTPSLVAAIGRGQCLVADKYSEMKDDLRLVQRTTYRPISKGLLPEPIWGSIVQFGAYRGSGKADEPLVWQTYFTKVIALAPTMMFADGPSSGGGQGLNSWQLWQARLPVGDKDFANFFLQRLARLEGREVAGMPTAIDQQSSRRAALATALDNPGGTRAGHSLRTILNEWLAGIDNSSAAPEDVTLLERVVRDRRMTDITLAFDKLRVVSEDAFVRALPDLLARLSAPPLEILEKQKQRGFYDFDRANLSYAIARLPSRSLSPYSDDILALVQSSDASWTAGLVKCLGKLPTDTSPLIRSRLRSSNDFVANAAAYAACVAPPEIQATLKDDLFDALRQGGQSRAVPLLTALIRMGQKDTAIALANKLGIADRLGMLKELATDFDPSNCRW